VERAERARRPRDPVSRLFSLLDEEALKQGPGQVFAAVPRYLDILDAEYLYMVSVIPGVREESRRVFAELWREMFPMLPVPDVKDGVMSPSSVYRTVVNYLSDPGNLRQLAETPLYSTIIMSGVSKDQQVQILAGKLVLAYARTLFRRAGYRV
jgi:hypothetical protein